MPEEITGDKKRGKRKQHSIATRVFNASLLNCIIIGLVSLLIGLGFYTAVLSRQLISSAFNVADSASVPVSHGADSVGYASRVMDIYHGLSVEERQQAGTPEYRSHFAHLTEDHDYDILVHMLRGLLESNDVYDVYYAMYDLDTGALVYLVDPDRNEETVCLPGDWEPVERAEIERFLNWDGEGELYDVGRTEKYGWLCTAGVPVRDEQGQIAGFVLADITLENVISQAKNFVIQFGLSVIVLTALISVFSMRRMKNTVVTPINEIAEAAQNYVNDKKEGKDLTGHFSALNINTGDEIEHLSRVMADMERDIDSYTENLTAVTAEKARLNSELYLASAIQSAMLPHTFPPYPDRTEFDLYATMEPARAVGGDFYDFFLMDDDHLCMVIADVSGKGVPASLFMMVSKVLIKSIAMLESSAKEIFERTNKALCEDNPEDMFVTCWLGILEISTGKLTAVNAGHEYPVVMEPGGDFVRFKEPHSFALGGFASETYTPYEIQLKPGSRLFVYTDGVPEAMDPDRNPFGTGRMLSALNGTADRTPEKLLENVRNSVRAFVRDAEQFDDLTMLCIEYKGK